MSSEYRVLVVGNVPNDPMWLEVGDSLVWLEVTDDLVWFEVSNDLEDPK